MKAFQVGSRVRLNPKIFGVRLSQARAGAVIEDNGSSYIVQWDGEEEDWWNPGQRVKPMPMSYDRIELVSE